MSETMMTASRRQQRRYRLQSPIVRTRRTPRGRARSRLSWNERHPHVVRTGRVIRAAHRRVSTWGTITPRTVKAAPVPKAPTAAQNREHEARRRVWFTDGAKASRALADILEHNRQQHAAERARRAKHAVDLDAARQRLRPPHLPPRPDTPVTAGRRVPVTARAGAAQYTKDTEGRFTGSVSSAGNRTPGRRTRRRQSR